MESRAVSPVKMETHRGVRLNLIKALEMDSKRSRARFDLSPG